VNQVFVLLFLPYRLNFALNHEFGKSKEVYAGLCTVATEFEKIGKNIIWKPADSTYTRFVLASIDPEQFFHPDPAGLLNQAGSSMHIGSAVGDTFENQLLRGKILQVNDATRGIRFELEVTQPELVERGQVFIYEDDEMKRIR